MVDGSAPGKVILLGEHAVVYGRPAIAVPVSQVRAKASVEETSPGSGLMLMAPDVGRTICLKEAPPDDSLAVIARLTLAHLGLESVDAVITVNSTIPIAGGMGSGAAVATAVARALAGFLGKDLPAREVSRLVFEVEKLHHGTPSGIDNTVVAYERPVYYVQGQPPKTFSPGAPLCLLVADSGISSNTREVVMGVRERWEAEPVRYDFLFDRVGDLVEDARQAIVEGDPYTLGPLMDQNHELLQEMQVSSPELDELAEAARGAGALGAKLTGAGRGGNVIALVEDEVAGEVEEEFAAAGAVRVIVTTVA